MHVDAASSHELNSSNGHIASPQADAGALDDEDVCSDTIPVGTESVDESTAQKHHSDLSHTNGDAQPPLPAAASKKRKFAELDTRSRSTSRAVSPPWKAFGANGPTQFAVDGKRRSGRVNTVPLDLQPPSDKRKTRAAHSAAQPDKKDSAACNLRQGRSKDVAATSTPAVMKEARPSTATKPPVTATAASSVPTRPLSQRHAQKVEDAAHVNEQKQRENVVLSEHPKTSPSLPSAEKKKKPSRTTTTSKPAIPESPTRPRRSTVVKHETSIDSPARPSPRLRLKLPRYDLAPSHPYHIAKPSPYASLEDALAHFDQVEKEQGLADRDTDALDELERRVVERPKQTLDEQALKEAQIRLRIVQAGKPGGCLSVEKSSIYLPDEQPEPAPQYGHVSHLWAHGAYFRTLLGREKSRHVEMAKKVAHACLAKWKEKQPQTEEEKQSEEDDSFRLIYKQTVRDVQRKWELVTAEIEKQRLAQWEEDRELARQRNMQRFLEKSTKMLDQRRQGIEDDADDDLVSRDAASSNGDEEDDLPMANASDDDGADRDENDDENFSSEESEQSDEASLAGGHDDDQLSPEALKAKYQAMADDEADTTALRAGSQELDDDDDDDDERVTDGDTADMLVAGAPIDVPSPADEQDVDDSQQSQMAVSNVALEEVDDLLLDDDDDESTDMDSDMGSSDQEEASDDDAMSDDDDVGEQGSDDDAADADVGLMGFFGGPERKRVQNVSVAEDADMKDAPHTTEPESQLATPPADQGPTQEQDKEALHQTTESLLKLASASPQDVGHSSETSPRDDTTAESTEADSNTSVEVDETFKDAPSSEQTPQPTRPGTTKIPSLLRGTLREYQHHGLDWLAKLYANQTNGILADEMGLGKTIQTIALLAHLAEEHEVWGPHLIVVPTSVILNWEMEFKKFLPGFKVLSYYGSAEERALKRKGWSNPDNWNVVITSYQLILKDLLAIRVPEWHYLILDEAHNIKNFNSQRYQAMIRLKTHARLLLTGTPLQNSIQELWSLLTFLTAGQDGQGMGDLEEFTQWFRRPVDEIFVDGRNKLGIEAQAVVDKLHHSLRPYILRRMKAQVEQQLPGKYEHTVMCRLSKRQRQLYDAFMGRSETKAQLSSGNMISVSQALMALRKVCNHPDLFEERPIVTSFTMRKPWSKAARSIAADFEITDLLVRRHLMADEQDGAPDLGSLKLNLVCREQHSRYHVRRSHDLRATDILQDVVRQARGESHSLAFDGSTLAHTTTYQNSLAQSERLDRLRRYTNLTEQRTSAVPVYGRDLIERCTIYTSDRMKLPTLRPLMLPRRPQGMTPREPQPWPMPRTFEQYSILPDIVKSVDWRGDSFNTCIQKFGFVTPNAVAHDLLPYMMPPTTIDAMRKALSSPTPDAFHEARVRMSIAFPDKRLLQYDCGKLQQLALLLRQLQARGSRALIFTQMTSVLNILEQFLNIYGYRYLRLDGSTRIEQRQDMMERFNRDARLDVFILSSRSGGVGMNLTGADAVIFYDLDWNPQMDKQCQDRAHRIGQTRDVHIYKLVSEHTIEVNILRKSNQKRMLDEVVIQEGDFTTDNFNNSSDAKADDDAALVGDDFAGQAVDRVFGGQHVEKILEAAEDVVDVEAAHAQQKALHVDDADFGHDNARPVASKALPGSALALDAIGQPIPGIVPHSTQDHAAADARRALAGHLGPDGDAIGMGKDADLGTLDLVPHVDSYMLGFVQRELAPVAFVPPVDKSRRGRLDKNGRDRSHRARR